MTSIIVEGDVMSRKQAQTLLGQGIAINSKICPGNYAAGLYAVNTVLASLLSKSFYESGTVEFCSFLLTMVPCNLNPDSTATPAIFVGLYGTVIRSCGLKSRGVE